MNRFATQSAYALLFLLPLTLLAGTWSLRGLPFFLSDVLCLLLIVALLVVGRGKGNELIPSHPTVRLALALMILGLLTGVLESDSLGGALNALKSWFLLPAAIAFLTVTTFDTEASWAKARSAVLHGITALGLVEAVAGIVRWQQHLYIEDRLAGYYNSPNAYAAGAVFALIAALWLAWETPGKLRWWYGAAALFILLTVVLSRSLGGVASLVAVVALFAFRLSQPYLRKVMLAVVVALLCFGGFVAAHRYQSFAGSSLQSRFQIWRVAGSLIREQPLVGIGLRDFQARYAVRVHELYPLATDIVEQEVPEPHSLYLAWLVYNGIVGAIGFLLFFGLLLVLNLRKPFGPETWAGALLLAVLVHGLVDTPFYRLDLSILAWLAVLLSLKTLYVRT